jgi:hypothetical protein
MGSADNAEPRRVLSVVSDRLIDLDPRPMVVPAD